jgi:3-oxoacyl-[acyl-carrier protein] reductase
MRLSGQVAIVTGGSRGIGRATAVALAGEGARVVVSYRDRKEAAGATVAQIAGRGGEASSFQADVRRPEEVEAMVAFTLERFGQIDILVNSAGVIRDNLLLSMSEADWREVIETNLGGVFHATRAVVGPMLLRRHGAIISVSSMVSDRFGIGQGNYAASKGGINAFTKALARELAPKGITVNAVAPGLIETDMSAEAVKRASADRRLLPRLGRIGTPEDVAPVIVFLASDEARYITGEIIHVDGGLL